MEILVTGATGFIGFNLARALIEKGHRVRVLIRDSSPQKRVSQLKEMGAFLIKGDLREKESLDGAVLGTEMVFHIAGVLGRFSLPDEIYLKTHIEGTKNILDACRKNPHLKQFIFCSTVGVLGPARGRILDEKFPYYPTNIYERTKTEAEKLVVTFIKDGFRATIIRPGMVYGPYDSHILQMFRAIKKKRFFLIGRGKNFLHLVYIDDLVNGFLLVMDNEKAFGQIYHIAGEKAQLKVFFETMAESMGLKLPWFKIPVWVACLLLYPIIFLARVFKFNPILTKSRLNFFTQSRQYSIEKAERELGYRPKTGLKKGMALSFEYYKREGLL